jgi:hypothetical protein
MLRNLWSGVSLAFTLLAAAFLASCGNVGSAPINNLNTISGISVDITPSAITVGTTTITPFTATVNGSGVQAVQWQVNGIPGGAPAIGTIDASGNYTAPQFVPNPANVTITAIPNADNTKSGNASVNITGTLFPATVYMSPTGTAYVQTGTPLELSAGVTGPADTGVTWQVNGVPDGNSTLGTITPGTNGSAVYNAPARLPNPSTVTIKAVSHAEPSRFNSCTVVLSSTAPTVATVTVTPALAIDQAETNFTFSAKVINASDSSVSWEVNGSMGGDQVFGTIASEGPETGVYTAPIVVPQFTNVATVRAVSNAQPNRGSSGGVLISPLPANGVSVSVSGGTSVNTDSSEQITAVVNADGLGVITNPGVTWKVNGVLGGNETYGMVQVISGSAGNAVNYIAPDKVPPQNTVVVEAISQQDANVVGTLPITISQPVTTVDVQTPTGQRAIDLGIGQAQLFEAIIAGQQNQNAIWYVCATSQNCTLNGNDTVGTISPTTPSDAVTYTAPTTIPNPATVIIKAVSQANPNASGTATVTIVSQQVITVQVTPPGPFTDQVNQTLPSAFTATVNGSGDQNVTWYVCNTNNPPVCFANGNGTYGTLSPDPNYPDEEDYLAPGSVPSPATVDVEAVPEADPSVVSNAVPITIVPFSQQQTVTINLQYPVILPTQMDTVSASVVPGPDQTVNWTLSLPASEGGGDCTNLPQTCGTINPRQTDNTQATYTPPNPTPNNKDPWYVEITATSNAYQGASATAQVEITKEATASISISPNPPPPIQAGTQNFINFTVTIVNGQQDQTVDWTLQCASEANGDQWCGSPFGTGAWTGCIEGTDGQQQCSSGSLDEPGNTAMTYTPPPKTGSQFQQNACVSQPGGPDMIPLSASISTDQNNCTQDSCTAVACITIEPAGAK